MRGFGAKHDTPGTPIQNQSTIAAMLESVRAAKKLLPRLQV